MNGQRKCILTNKLDTHASMHAYFFLAKLLSNQPDPCCFKFVSDLCAFSHVAEVLDSVPDAVVDLARLLCAEVGAVRVVLARVESKTQKRAISLMIQMRGIGLTLAWRCSP